MVNFVEKLKDGILKDGLSILKDINEKYINYNKDSHCKCKNCNDFLNYISEFNKKRDLESYEKEENLYRKDLMRINHKVVNLDSLYDEDSFFLLNLKRLITLSSHDDWFSFGNYYYCEDCFSFYDIISYYEEDENTNELFKSSCSIKVLTNFSDIKNLLSDVFIYKCLLKLSDVYKDLELNKNIYAYNRLEYDLGLDPLWSFKNEESKAEHIENDIYYTNLNFDFELSKFLISSNSIHFGSSGFCRLTIDEKDLIVENSGMTSGLSGFISGFHINILKEKVKNIEFYDIVNDNWISFDNPNLKKLIDNNNKYLSDENNLKFYNSLEKESNLIISILDFYNENIDLLKG